MISESIFDSRDHLSSWDLERHEEPKEMVVKVKAFKEM